MPIDGEFAGSARRNSDLKPVITSKNMLFPYSSNTTNQQFNRPTKTKISNYNKHVIIHDSALFHDDFYAAAPRFDN